MYLSMTLTFPLGVSRVNSATALFWSFVRSFRAKPMAWIWVLCINVVMTSWGPVRTSLTQESNPRLFNFSVEHGLAGIGTWEISTAYMNGHLSHKPAPFSIINLLNNFQSLWQRHVNVSLVLEEQQSYHQVALSETSLNLGSDRFIR